MIRAIGEEPWFKPASDTLWTFCWSTVSEMILPLPWMLAHLSSPHCTLACLCRNVWTSFPCRSTDVTVPLVALTLSALDWNPLWCSEWFKCGTRITAASVQISTSCSSSQAKPGPLPIFHPNPPHRVIWRIQKGRYSYIYYSEFFSGKVGRWQRQHFELGRETNREIGPCQLQVCYWGAVFAFSRKRMYFAAVRLVLFCFCFKSFGTCPYFSPVQFGGLETLQ